MFNSVPVDVIAVPPNVKELPNKVPLELMFPLAVMCDEKLPALAVMLFTNKSPLALISPSTVNFFVGVAVPIPTLSSNSGLNLP